ncbi:MAG: DsbA family protein [Alphaproteobacteria bacterium]
MTRIAVVARWCAILLLALWPAAGARAQAPTLETMLADRVIGKPDAPLTIIEYASLTCGHCASFHKDTLPKLKTEWLDTGKAKLVFRDFPLDGVALRAAMAARCMPEERYFPVLDVLFKNQDNWARARDPIAALGGIARLSGLSQEAFDACLKNEPLQKGILAKAFEGQQQHKVESTPTFIVGNEAIRGAVPWEEFERVLKKAAGGG